MKVVQFFVHTTAFLERYVLGLKYEIKGQENLPKDGSYIIASKHQSAYETFKLHILFKDPAIILKQELFKIPLWGQYLKKSDVIAIDRSTPKTAIKSIQDGARRMMERNRPIVIFPQGTRVLPETTAQERPYKIGIIRIQEATALPIIPMALNTGIFYPKKGWVKKPGTITFEFLKPIPYDKNQDIGQTLQHLEDTLEDRSNALMNEATQQLKARKTNPLKTYGAIIAIIFALYSTYWFAAANLVQNGIIENMDTIASAPEIITYDRQKPTIQGFPAKLRINIPAQKIISTQGTISIDSIHAKSWPTTAMPIDIRMQNIGIKHNKWPNNIVFQELNATITDTSEQVVIHHGEVLSGDATLKTKGTILLGQDYPEFDLDVEIYNSTTFLKKLAADDIIKQKVLVFIGFGLKALEKDGVVKTKIKSQDNKVYLGPIKIHEFPVARPSSLLLQENKQN